MSSKRCLNTARKSTTRNGPPKEDKVSYEEESDGTLCMIVENGETRKRSKLGQLPEGDESKEKSDEAESNGNKTSEVGEKKTAKADAVAGESADSEPDSADSEDEEKKKSAKADPEEDDAADDDD